MAEQSSTAVPYFPTDSEPARAGMRAEVVEFLSVVLILADYGRHLSETLQSRAVRRGFATIAQFFGTASINTILAQLYRGVLRCIALDRVLRDRARRGFGLRVVGPRAPSRRKENTDGAPAEDQPDDEQVSAQAEAKAQAKAEAAVAARVRRIAAGMPLTFETVPSMADIEAEVRRNPVGRTVGLICRDLGVSLFLCTAPFGNRLLNAIGQYGGSLDKFVLGMKQREREFEKKELDRNPALDWPEQRHEGVRRVLGFLIGEPPVDPSAADPAPVCAEVARDAVALPGTTVVIDTTGPP